MSHQDPHFYIYFYISPQHSWAPVENVIITTVKGTFGSQTALRFFSLPTGSSHQLPGALSDPQQSCCQNEFAVIKTSSKLLLFFFLKNECPSRRDYFLCLPHPVISSTFSLHKRFHRSIAKMCFQVQLNGRTLPVLAINCTALEDGVQNLAQREVQGDFSGSCDSVKFLIFCFCSKYTAPTSPPKSANPKLPRSAAAGKSVSAAGVPCNKGENAF